MLPILATFVFGIVEVSFLLRDYATVASDVRIGARIASTGADAGPGGCTPGPDGPPCVPASVPLIAQRAADAIQRSGSALPPDAIDHVLIYQANAEGFPGANGSTFMPATCAGVPNCVRFTWVRSRDAFRYADGAWASAQISACFPGTETDPLDRVGVHLQARHQTLTGLLGRSFTLSERAVMDFEPLPTQTCAAGQHQ